MAGSRGASAGLIHLGDGITETDKPDASALREAWRRLHRTEPPAALSPDFLRRDIAYRQQMECLIALHDRFLTLRKWSRCSTLTARPSCR
jgi:hypothetical protein